MVKKADDAKAKAPLQICSSIREIDQHYSYNNWLTNFTIVKS